MTLDMVVRNGRVVFPGRGVFEADIGIGEREQSEICLWGLGRPTLVAVEAERERRLGHQGLRSPTA